MKSKYKYIVFDFDDTLFDYNASEEYALKKALDKIDVVYQNGMVDTFRQINRNMWKNRTQIASSVDEFYKLRSEAFLKKICVNDKTEEFNNTYLLNISTPFLVANAVEVIEVLRNFCKIYIATNGPRQIRENKLRNSRLNNLVDGFFSAETIGVSKPSLEFYKTLSLELDAQKDEILFVGDTFETDIIGALQFGCDACLLTHGAIFEKKVNSMHTINGLIDLITIVLETEKRDVFTSEDNLSDLIKRNFANVEMVELVPHGKSTYVFDVIINRKEYIFKFPKTEYAAHSLINELQNSICLSKILSVPIPDVKCCLSDNRFFCYYLKLSGENLSDVLVDNSKKIDIKKTIEDIASLILEISNVPFEIMPSSLKRKSDNMKDFIKEFAPDADLNLLRMIEQSENVLIHGDLHRSNVLVSDDGSLVGMIDLATFSKGSILFDIGGFSFSMLHYSNSFKTLLLKEFNKYGVNILEDRIDEIIQFLHNIIDKYYLPYILANT